MPFPGPTQRTNTSRIITKQRPTASKNQQHIHAKQHQSSRIKQPHSRFHCFSTIGILFLLTGGSCCALLFGMGIFSSFFGRNSTKAANSSGSAVSFSKLHHSSFALQTAAARAAATTTENVCSNNNNMSTDDENTRTEMENRLKGALWAFFAGDALASPTHWYYGGASQVVAEYGHPIRDYTKPNTHLSGSILNKSDPNGGGRIKSSLGSKSSKISIIGDVINHGKLSYWDPKQSYHYHATLQKGENTLEATLARVLMKSIVENHGSFDADHFRTKYIEFMQRKGSHNDTYASTCHRMFFANLAFNKLPPKDCPDNDSHNVDTIDGLVLPTIVALTGIIRKNPSTTIAESAGDCAGVTRKSNILRDTANRWSNVVAGAFGSDTCFSDSLTTFAKQTIRRSPDSKVRDASTMSACYLDGSLPGLVDMVAKYHASDGSGEAVWTALLSNANVGGENVHRASIMGAILGARAGYDSLPDKLVDGLYARSELEQEIEAFVNAVLSPN